MLGGLKRRAAKAGLLNRLNARLASPDSMALADLAGSVDFTLAFAGVDECPDAREFFRQIGAASKSRASLLLAEPRGQVESTKFETQLDAARGFGLHSRPSVPRSHAAFLHVFPSQSS